MCVFVKRVAKRIKAPFVSCHVSQFWGVDSVFFLFQFDVHVRVNLCPTGNDFTRWGIEMVYPQIFYTFIFILGDRLVKKYRFACMLNAL